MKEYEILQRFEEAGLAIVKRDWFLNSDGSCSFTGTIGLLSGEELPLYSKGSSPWLAQIRAASPEKVVTELFEIAKKETLLLGGHGNYHSIFVWIEPLQQFDLRKLTDDEKREKNGEVLS